MRSQSGGGTSSNGKGQSKRVAAQRSQKIQTNDKRSLVGKLVPYGERNSVAKAPTNPRNRKVK